MTSTVAPPRISAGTPELRRLQAAMVGAGLAAFALLYSTQALLPDIGRTYGVGATVTSLTIAVTTGVLALAVLPMSAVAERLGRTRVMSVSLAVACVAVLGAAAAPSLWVMLLARGVDGLALSGVVAVAMGHLGAEVDEGASGAAIGVYVSGTSIGGLIGRIVPAGVNALDGWRVSLIALAVVGALCTLAFTRLVPPARQQPPEQRPIHGVVVHLRDKAILRLCVVAFLLMGGFVATYNYLTYRLAAAPFSLSSSVIGLVFLAYLSGTLSSTLAARFADRHGRQRVLIGSILVAIVGLLVTLSAALPAVLVGLVLFTSGFFGAHSVASGWVAGRAVVNKSHASALYLLAYYLGSSVGGTAIGVAWSHGGWPITVTTVVGLYIVSALVAAGVPEPKSSLLLQPVPNSAA